MSEEKKYTVLTPNPAFSGIRLGIVFVNGRANVKRSTALLLCERFKYTCPELQGPEQAVQIGDNHQPEPVEAPPAEAPHPVEETQGQEAPAKKGKGKRKKAE